ncbi:hypothetical protein CCUS01_00586 [Colletotrichum cuscutae]|uniref:Uncharacterized protein n=1 Tax=Colletotrichum cuscutae TaxID=1209917 RepID=A0AAI9VBI4_9PEZI|nr:hypothetical protein CCUS01_00586 [Colletotrichum cuscutae]
MGVADNGSMVLGKTLLWARLRGHHAVSPCACGMICIAESVGAQYRLEDGTWPQGEYREGEVHWVGSCKNGAGRSSRIASVGRSYRAGLLTMKGRANGTGSGTVGKMMTVFPPSMQPTRQLGIKKERLQNQGEEIDKELKKKEKKASRGGSKRFEDSGRENTLGIRDTSLGKRRRSRPKARTEGRMKRRDYLEAPRCETARGGTRSKWGKAGCCFGSACLPGWCWQTGMTPAVPCLVFLLFLRYGYPLCNSQSGTANGHPGVPGPVLSSRPSMVCGVSVQAKYMLLMSNDTSSSPSPVVCRVVTSSTRRCYGRESCRDSEKIPWVELMNDSQMQAAAAFNLLSVHKTSLIMPCPLLHELWTLDRNLRGARATSPFETGCCRLAWLTNCDVPALKMSMGDEDGLELDGIELRTAVARSKMRRGMQDGQTHSRIPLPTIRKVPEDRTCTLSLVGVKMKEGAALPHNTATFVYRTGNRARDSRYFRFVICGGRTIVFVGQDDLEPKEKQNRTWEEPRDLFGDDAVRQRIKKKLALNRQCNRTHLPHLGQSVRHICGLALRKLINEVETALSCCRGRCLPHHMRLIYVSALLYPTSRVDIANSLLYASCFPDRIFLRTKDDGGGARTETRDCIEYDSRSVDVNFNPGDPRQRTRPVPVLYSRILGGTGQPQTRVLPYTVFPIGLIQT